MKNDQKGFIEEFGALLVLLLIAGFIFASLFVRFKVSQSVVSGIVYNTEVGAVISGKTTFSVRAGIDTYVNQSNESSFCLPKGSPYLALVEKAAKDKSIKVEVTANKYFAIQSPFTCHANVTVTQVK